MPARQSYFVSHGAPDLALSDCPARDFLRGLGAELGRPASVLVVSAHWETAAPRVSTVTRPETIHDFRGFAPELQFFHYTAPGAPELAARTVELLRAAGFEAGADAGRGLDHGAWVPLMLMFPDADVPVTQLSIQPELGPTHHLAVGRAIARLRDENVLVLATGSTVHNLAELDWNHGAPEEWARGFEEWLVESVERGDRPGLETYRRKAPHAVRAHPSDEHLLPLFVAMGAGTADAGRCVHRSWTYGNLSMAAFAFPDKAKAA